jgi:ABC-type polar amino acid transport system, ATPase component
MALFEIRGVHHSFHTYAKPGFHRGVVRRAPKPISSLDVLRGVDLTVEKGDVVSPPGPCRAHARPA